jgi:flagellar biogenesis protein FliO
MPVIFQRNLSRSKPVRSDCLGIVQLFIRRLLFQRRCGKRALQVLENVPLTTQSSVALVQFEKEILVLGVTPRNVTVLARNTTQETPRDGSVKQQ